MPASARRPKRFLMHALEDGLGRTQARLRAFEETYQMPTAQFIECYNQNTVEETLETIEWLGEYRLLLRIQDKLDTLKGIRIVV